MGGYFFALKPLPSADDRFRTLKEWLVGNVPARSYKVRYRKVLGSWNERLGREATITLVTGVEFTSQHHAALFKMFWDDATIPALA